MAGRREQQKRARRNRIIVAAKQLFASRGYRETGIGDIARRARLATGTLYNYFPSKPDIALAIVRDETSDALSQGEVIFKERRVDPVAAVAKLLDVYLETFGRCDRELWRETVAGAITDPHGLGVDFFAQDARLIRQLSALLQELQSRGALAKAAHTGNGAIAIYSLYTSWFMAYLANDAIPLAALREQVRAGVGIVVNGLLHPA